MSLMSTSVCFKYVFKEAIGVDVAASDPAYDLAGSHGSFRFRQAGYSVSAWNCSDVSEVVKGCGFGVFTGALENGGTVRGINAEGQGHMPRKKIDASW